MATHAVGTTAIDRRMYAYLQDAFGTRAFSLGEWSITARMGDVHDIDVTIMADGVEDAKDLVVAFFTGRSGCHHYSAGVDGDGHWFRVRIRADMDALFPITTTE